MSTVLHGLVVVHAGERLVEQQDRRVGGEADGDAERAQMAMRQVRWRARPRAPARPRKSRISSAETPNAASSAAAAAGAEEEAEQAGLRAQVVGDDDVVAHGHALEDRRLLEGAHHALAGHDVRRQVRRCARP